MNFCLPDFSKSVPIYLPDSDFHIPRAIGQINAFYGIRGFSSMTKSSGLSHCQQILGCVYDTAVIHVESHVLSLCMNMASAGNNFPGIASQFAMHFFMTAIQDNFCVAVFLHRSPGEVCLIEACTSSA